MDIVDYFLDIGEFAAAGMYEEPNRSLFYRKSLGIRRYLENCELPEFARTPLYPSGAINQKMKIFLDYSYGLSIHEIDQNLFSKEICQTVSNDFDRYRTSVPKMHAVAGNMYTHSIPAYERIINEGFLSYIPRIKKISDIDMQEGLLHLIKGIECYACRCVDYLFSVNANQSLINALKKVPLHPCDTIFEAIVAWNFVMYLDNCDNLGAVARSISPFYNGEDITDLLSNLYDNLNVNNGYSMSLDSECPELTCQFLKAAHGKRRPMIELFVDENTPDVVWKAALDLLHSKGGQPAFYNPKILLEGLKKRFPVISEEDFKRFCGGGCTESMISGMSNVGSLDAGINLLLIFEETLKTYLKSANDFEDFYKEYIKRVRQTVFYVQKEINRSRKERALYNPLPMRTLLVDDCIDKQMDFNDGGARYNWSIINFAGIINVIDSMLAVKTLVFDRKKYSSELIIEFLNNNDKAFLEEAKNLELAHGKDNSAVNEFAYRISHEIFTMTKETPMYAGLGFIPASIQFRSQISSGKIVGATPDGREKGAPLCDSLGAIFQKDDLGPTALLNSVTSLDLSSALGVPVLNLNLTNDFDDNILKALIMGYMKNGGVQLQITIASKGELIDAYHYPEKHRNLIVRVAGYSEYFNRLTDELKMMIINRTIQDSV